MKEKPNLQHEADHVPWLKDPLMEAVNCLERSAAKLSPTMATEMTELPLDLLELNWGFCIAGEEKGKEGMV